MPNVKIRLIANKQGIRSLPLATISVPPAGDEPDRLKPFLINYLFYRDWALVLPGPHHFFPWGLKLRKSEFSNYAYDA
jgi:hypothetical protein